MYKNQYLIASGAAKQFHSMVPQQFCNLNVFCHADLPIEFAHKDNLCILLLGYAFHPDYPEYSNQSIAQRLLKCAPDADSVFEEVEAITGRFVILLGEHTREGPVLRKILGDASSLRQIYYGYYEGIFYVTSSPKMFYDYSGKNIEIRPDKRNFMNDPQYTWNNCGWYCDEEAEECLKKLLPNHYYDHDLGR